MHRLGLTEFRFAAEPKGDFRLLRRGAQPDLPGRAVDGHALNTLDAYMDCPHRERNAMYGVEGYWMQKAVYPMFGDTSVSRRSDPLRGRQRGRSRSERRSARPGPRRLPDAPEVLQLRHSHAAAVLGAARRPVRALLGRHGTHPHDAPRHAAQPGRDGRLAQQRRPARIHSRRWMFFDYADIRTDGVSVALNAIYAKTLDEAARLERLAGDAARADDFEKLAQQVRDSLNRFCPATPSIPTCSCANREEEAGPLARSVRDDAVLRDVGRRAAAGPAAADVAGPARRFPAHAARRQSPADPRACPRRALPVPRSAWRWPRGWATTPRCCATPRPCSCPWSTARPAPCGKTPWPGSPCVTASAAEWAAS